MTLCIVCTFENHADLAYCELCESPLAPPAPSPYAPSVAWELDEKHMPPCQIHLPRDSKTCPICTLMNHADVNFCEGCQYSFNLSPIDDMEAINASLLDMKLNYDEIAQGNGRYIRCPNCQLAVEVTVVACGIFVCGTSEKGQLPQHGPPGGVPLFGCGKQFELVDGVPRPCAGK